MKRRRMSRRSSRRNFTRGAKTNVRNLGTKVPRGGFRL